MFVFRIPFGFVSEFCWNAVFMFFCQMCIKIADSQMLLAEKVGVQYRGIIMITIVNMIEGLLRYCPVLR